MKLWAKMILKHKILQDIMLDVPEDSRPLTDRVKEVLDEVILDFDLPRPIWFQQNEQDLSRFGSTSFGQDHFIEEIRFTKLEIELIEEEEKKRA